MADMILKKKALADFLKSLGRSYQVFGPKQEGGEVRFGPADGEVLLDYQNSRLSPRSSSSPSPSGCSSSTPIPRPRMPSS